MAVPFFVGQPPLGIPFKLNQASPQARGLVAWWPSNAFPHRQPRDLAGANHGTKTGSVAWAADGAFGQVLNFPGGGSDYVALANQDFTHMSVTAWIYRDSTADGAGHIISRHPDWFLSAGGGVIRFNINGIAEASLGSLASFDNGWHFAAATYDRVNIIGYRDGFPITTTAYTGAIGASGTQRMGGYGGGGFLFKGKLADMRLYNRALSPGEILAMYLPQTRYELYAPLWKPAYYVPPVVAGQPMALRQSHILTGVRRWGKGF